MSVILAPPIGPLVAARTYLLAALQERGNALPVGVTPPPGQPASFALLSRLGSHDRSRFTTDYLIRVRIFDADAVRAEDNADLIYGLLFHARHQKITVGARSVWVSGTDHQLGPSQLDDPDVPLHGYQVAVYWTLATKPA